MQDGPHRDSQGLVTVEEALISTGIYISSQEDVEVKQLSGGLTNDNLLITLGDVRQGDDMRRIVLRRFYLRTAKHLGYNRDQEYDNSCIAAEAKKVGAVVIGHVCCTEVHGGAIALEFIEGETLDERSMKTLCTSTEGLTLLANTLRKMHDPPIRFTNTFDPFQARRYYEDQVKIITGISVPWSSYKAFVEKLTIIEAYLRATPEEQVDCHNDLLGANFILSHDCRKLTIVDWELSGQAEPSWELGNFISENDLDEDADVISALLSLYWSHPTGSKELDEKIRRARLYSMVSKVTWAAWGAVLHNLDKSNTFDYEEWCMKKLQRAERAMSDQEAVKKLML